MELRLPPSAKPQILRAAHEWCSENGLTPYMIVAVDSSVSVPKEFVSDGQIVLNTSYEATASLRFANEFITFQARFGGKSREIMVPIPRVLALFAKETGEGAYFEVSDLVLPMASDTAATGDDKVQEEQPFWQMRSGLNSDKEAIAQDPNAPRLQDAAGGDGNNEDPPPSPPVKPGPKPFLVRVK